MRDEVSNLVGTVEHLVTSLGGTLLDRYKLHQRSGPVLTSPPPTSRPAGCGWCAASSMGAAMTAPPSPGSPAAKESVAE
jgi:hypothetical protein